MARLHAEVIVLGVVHFEAEEILHRLAHGRMLVAVTEGLERHQRVHHAWKDGAEAIRAFAGSLQNPSFGLFERATAERLPRQRFEEFEHPVPAKEKILPGEKLRVE